MTSTVKASANRFRFRAWDKNEKKMFYDVQDSYDYMGFGDGKALPVMHFGEIVSNNSDYVLMQSTGLTDEEGSELFEHDIVECEEKTNVGRRTGRYVLCYFEEASEWVLVDVDGFTLAGYTHHTAESLNAFGAETLLKVGNVYENPDLLPSSCLK